MTAPPIAIRPACAPGDLPAPALKCVVLINVKYSPNLGDGLLSECLERELARVLPGCRVVSADLAGRSAYPAAHGRARGLALALLERCPAPLRRIAARAMLQVLIGLRLRRRYRAALAAADAVVVGGGNLLTDADLNFPMKIAGALEQAARRSLPVAVHAVGVSPQWSPTGAALFGKALRRSRLVWASVRDDRSHACWRRHLPAPAFPPAHVVGDPGLLACLHYPRAPASPDGRRIGFGVTDPLAVRYHSDRASAAMLDAWYPAALCSLVRHGFEVVLFTNGSPEDREYLQARCHDWIRRAKGPVIVGRSFATPADLATFVSGCDGVVGHRLHACIAAYSFGVPAVGLRWDVKLDSFFDVSGRAAHMLDPAAVPASMLGARMAAAIADRFNPAALVSRTQAHVARLATVLQASAA